MILQYSSLNFIMWTRISFCLHFQSWFTSKLHLKVLLTGLIQTFLTRELYSCTAGSQRHICISKVTEFILTQSWQSWPISGCADSCSVAHLSPWGQRTTQSTHGLLDLAPEQKKVSSMASVPVLYSSSSSSSSLHQPSEGSTWPSVTSTTTQQDTSGRRSKLWLIIWTYGMLCLSVSWRVGGINQWHVWDVTSHVNGQKQNSWYHFCGFGRETSLVKQQA